jgi:hypothetical protein
MNSVLIFKSDLINENEKCIRVKACTDLSTQK